MKKIIIITLTIMVMFLIYNETKANEVIIPSTAIRLRVIPNSNSAIDQRIKMKVKNYLENNTYQILKGEDNIDEARKIIKESLPNIEENIAKIFTEENYQMPYSVKYGYNYFPEKEYRGIKYEEGYYESIVISIGKSEGDNWWCVLFPNLCLADVKETDDVEYKSWIIEEISKIF